jgi:truncated hemoglobin YjbI
MDGMAAQDTRGFDFRPSAEHVRMHRMDELEAIGGEAGLRAILDDFVDRCTRDVMIGFLFRRADPERIKRFELEHALEFLGKGRYGGKPIREAHARHAILGGQFARRRKLLEDTLRDHGAPESFIARFLAHQDALRPLVTPDADASTCVGGKPPTR